MSVLNTSTGAGRVHLRVPEHQLQRPGLAEPHHRGRGRVLREAHPRQERRHISEQLGPRFHTRIPNPGLGHKTEST